MRVLCSNIICCILAVLMLFSCVCLDSDNAENLYETAPVSQAAAVIDSLDKEISDNQSCTIDMLGIRNVSNAIRAVKRTNFKMDTRIFAVLFCADLFTHNISVLHAVADTAELPDLYYKTAILSYIQSIDGKK